MGGIQYLLRCYQYVRLGVRPIGNDRHSGEAALFTEVSGNQDKVEDIHDAVTVNVRCCIAR